VADLPYQSLYRRYRPRRFSEVRGQEHVVKAVRNAVRDGKVAHAYLFSGPRGTGKTSTARILAKALNCTDLQPDGDCCGVCESCRAVDRGASFDVIELDAASNRKIEDVRSLLETVAIGTGGQKKVYIVDEVHQLTADASSALLKTLEEPPEHVVFVLATTDPQKVLPTIRSRTQHYEFKLLNPEVLAHLAADVAEAAGLALSAHDLDTAVRRGRGSARDTLSVLDQVAAAGGAEDEADVAGDVVDALAGRDPGAVLATVAAGAAAGRDPRRLAVELVERLRNAFLCTQAPDLVDLTDSDRAAVADQARRLGPAALVRAMETLGEALVEMRESVDTRVTLEVALVRLAKPELDTSLGAIVERLERLERAATSAAAGPGPGPGPGPAGRADGAGAPPPATAAVAGPPPPSPSPPTPAAAATAGPPPSRSSEAAASLAGPRAALGAVRAAARATPPAPPAPPTRPPPSGPAPEPLRPGPGGEPLPTREALTKAWGDTVFGRLSPKTKALWGAGRWVTVPGDQAGFAVENPHQRDHCEERRAEVERALSTHFGRPVPVKLMVDDGALAGPAPDDEADEDLDPHALVDAAGAVASPEERLLQAFPGAEEVP
jgi:DNA polymerase-3 subunit gamma/tau